MRINKEKGIGTVVFLVEGQKNYYQKGNNPMSKVFVINTSSSNLSSIEDTDFIDLNIHRD